MLKLLLRTCISGLRSRQGLALENLALRHQLEVLQRTAGRPRLRATDRALWVLLRRICHEWRRHLLVIQPDTVVRWHRLGWRLYWRRRSRRRRPGRPAAESEVRALIRRLSLENPLWGAPRVHGELLKLGYELAEGTVAKYMVKQPGPPSQSWRTFVRNHLAEAVTIDFFTVPTATFRTLYVFLVPVSLAEWLRRARYRLHEARVPGQRDRVRRVASEMGAAAVRGLLPPVADSPRPKQRHARAQSRPWPARGRRIQRACPRRLASPLLAPGGLTEKRRFPCLLAGEVCLRRPQSA